MPKHTQRRVSFYHVTRHRFCVGDIVRPNGSNSGSGGTALGSIGTDVVFMSTSAIPHYTMVEPVELGVFDEWHVYEVEPLGKVQYGGCWDEVGSTFVRILKYIGNAKGIMKNNYPHWREKNHEICRNGNSFKWCMEGYRGSAVRPRKGINRTT